MFSGKNDDDARAVYNYLLLYTSFSRDAMNNSVQKRSLSVEVSTLHLK